MYPDAMSAATCYHRNARSAAKGAQYILYQAELHDDLRSALADCHVSVAFTRWVAGRSNTFRDITGLLGHPAVTRCLELPAAAAGAAASSGTQGHHQQGGITAAPAAASQQHDVTSTAQPAAQPQESAPAAVHAADVSTSAAQALGGPPKLALVFGREELGLSDDELAACDLACSIPIGRLQESLSLGHAVTVVLSQLYQARQELGADAADDASG
jgi:tRNA C32,U32 (ribose-2'-O)-methylase TrmJ